MAAACEPALARVQPIEPNMPEIDPPPSLDPTRHAFFLDLDGTLAPIVADPAAAAIAPDTRDLLAALLSATEGAVAILSGRALADVDRLTAPLRFPAGGSHGLELRFDRAAEHATLMETDTLNGLREEIQAFATARRLLAEIKPGAIALHYRQDPAQEQDSRALIDRLASQSGDLRALHGKMVSEVTQATADKGTALRALAQHPPFAGRIPVMLGDDVTDEDGFAAAQELGGFGVKIGTGATQARHRAASMEAALNWLGSCAGTRS